MFARGTHSKRTSLRTSRVASAPPRVPAPHAVSTLLVRTSDLAPRDRTSRLVKTRLTRVVPTTCTSRRDADVSRGSDDCRLARPSHFITLTITHCTFCRCAARGPVPDRRARACLGLGMPLQLRFYNHGTLSTSQPVHNSSDPSWCAERGSDADPCHRIAARPSPQTSTAPRHPWTSFAFCSLRRGPT